MTRLATFPSAPGREPGSGSEEEAEAAWTEAHERWMQVMAALVTRVLESAKGGALVLCNSYADIQRLAGLLAEGYAERLVVQSPRCGAVACQGEFRAKYQAGVRPVWLGTGPAWTGLDLSLPDTPAHLDRLLTDVVVVRVPFGANHTTTFLTLCEWRGYRVVVQEAAMRFRQGLGRLVRRPGVTDRRLWILDPRCGSGAPHTRLLGRIVGSYPHRKPIELPDLAEVSVARLTDVH